MIFFSSFWNISLESFVLVRQIHLISAVIWMLVLIAMTFVLGLKFHKSTIKLLFRWGQADIDWLRLSLLSLVNAKVDVTDPRIYDVRLKMNFLLVLFSCVAFIVTGFQMWFWNTILIAWHVHTILFFMTIGMMSGHLYITFTRPPSKKLPLGSYMKVELIFSVLTIAFGIAGVFIFNQGEKAALSKDFNHFIRPQQLSSKHNIKELADCKICHAYAGELRDKNCLTCHKIIKERMDNKLGFHGKVEGSCIKCHKEHPKLSGSIVLFEEKKFNHDEALFKLTGGHTGPKIKCEQCHKRTKTKDIKNVKDVTAVYYLGMPFEKCTDCHKDPHRNELGDKCEPCHNTITWKGKDLLYNHERDSKYKLVGKHQSPIPTPCDKCHKPLKPGDPLGTAKFKGLPLECGSGCHKDPHRDELGKKCETCHNFNSWKGQDLNYNHERDSKYKLVGKHQSPVPTPCDKCHKPAKPGDPIGTAKFKGLSYECGGCHKDPHKNELGKKCETCHNFNSWKGKDVTFNHDKDSKYKLVGKHQSPNPTACEKCHKPAKPTDPLGTAKFKGLPLDCLGCHKDPHKDELGKKCETCHNILSWKGKDVTFNHDKDSKYKLVGKHQSPNPTPCEKCHKPAKPTDPLGTAKFKGGPLDCLGCHKDPHKDELGKKCETCHNIMSWKDRDVTFNHDKDSKYKLIGKHKSPNPTACEKCHKPLKPGDPLGTAKFKGLPVECIDCHKDPHKDKPEQSTYGVLCVSCHHIDFWGIKGKKFDHNSDSKYHLADKHQDVPKCTDCHKKEFVPKLGAVPVADYSTKCLICHKDPHKNTLGPVCTKCHTLKGWKGKACIFKHTVHSKYDPGSLHKNTTCKACHPKNLYKPIKYKECEDCHSNLGRPGGKGKR